MEELTQVNKKSHLCHLTRLGLTNVYTNENNYLYCTLIIFLLSVVFLLLGFKTEQIL